MAKRTRIYTKFSQIEKAAAQDGFEYMQRLQGLRNHFLFQNPETGRRRVYTPYGMKQEYTPTPCGLFHQPITAYKLPQASRQSWNIGKIKEGREE